jgi:glyoxylase-like metal-dependent hydrolase (beta-lactamase superfamily II)
MMAFPFLKERCPWMKIVSSEQNQETFSNERIMTKIFDSDRKMTQALFEKRLISEAPALPPHPSFQLDIPVREGSILDLGRGMKIRFIETPGHAPDGLCAYQEEEGVLFCSDAAGFYVPPDFFRPNYWFNLKEADRSFYRMRGLDPEILCRGHYGVIMGKEVVRRHLQMAHQSIEDFKNFVLDRIQGGGSIEQMAQEVTERFSKGLLDLFPAEDNLRLWKLLVRRTLEYLGIEMEERL